MILKKQNLFSQTLATTACFLFLILAFSQSAAAQTMEKIGEFTSVNTAKISGNGTAIGGQYGDNVFKYTTDGGLVDVGILDPGGYPEAYFGAISTDGSTIIGESYDGSSYVAFKHTDAGGIVSLGTLGGSSSDADAVSSDGSVIVGFAQNSSSYLRAFKYTQLGGMVDLGTLGGDKSRAWAVSADGSVTVGDAQISSSDTYAFKHTDGDGMVSLGTLGGTYSSASVISADGNVISGVSNTAGGDGHAFKYVGSTMTDLGTLGGNHSYAKAISFDGSVIVGDSRNSDGDYNAFKYEGSTMTNLGTLGGDTSYATAVSADGSIIVGHAEIAGGNQHAFKYVGTTMTDLGTLGGASSYAEAISDDGTIISGRSQTSSGDFHIFLIGTLASISMVDVNNTYASLYANGSQLNSVINLNHNALHYALDQDVTLFGKNNLGVSIGTRYTNIASGKTEETAANVKVAYRFNNHFRAGVFLDQTINNNSLPDNFDITNTQPLTGLFAVLSKNSDGLGPELKLSTAYNASELTITRDNALDNTEAGQGRTRLSSKGISAELAYGLKLSNKWIVKPYLGLRKTIITRSGYVEENGADFPITYNSLERKATTAILGTKFTGYITKNLGTQLGLGIEHDTSNAMDGYSGDIQTMGAFNLNPSKMRKNRGFASLGGFYNLKQDQRVSFNFQYAQQSMNHDNGVTAFVNYTIGL